MRDPAPEPVDHDEFMRRLYERIEEHAVVIKRLLQTFGGDPLTIAFNRDARRTIDQAHLDWMDRTDYLGVRALEENAELWRRLEAGTLE